jgi:hypothetical protein
VEENRELSDEILVVGDKVDIIIPAGQVYRAMIEDRLDNGPFLLGVPSNKGVPMPVYQDDDVYLVFYRETGRYIAHMKVVALERRGTVRYMWLLQKTKAQKNQRRGAFRLPVSFNVQIFEYDEEAEHDIIGTKDEEVQAVAFEAVNSRDISVTGISMLTKKMYVLEERYVLSMFIDTAPVAIRARATTDNQPPLQVTATVKRCTPWRTNNMFNTGMQFFGVTRSTNESIARYVLTEQQKQIKKRRLI